MNSSEAILRVIKLKLCRLILNISLYKKIFYCHCLSTLVPMATLNFHRLVIGKNESYHSLLFHCRYFDECFFLEMCVEISSTKHILFV